MHEFAAVIRRKDLLVDGFDSQVLDSLYVPCLVVQTGGREPEVVGRMPVEVCLEIAADFFPSRHIVDEIRGGGVFAKL